MIIQDDGDVQTRTSRNITDHLLPQGHEMVVRYVSAGDPPT